jgi:hypothetical protein
LRLLRCLGWCSGRAGVRGGGRRSRDSAEHIAAHPEDAGRTVKDFNWVVHEIVNPKFIIGADGSVRWPDETIAGVAKIAPPTSPSTPDGE